MLRPHRWPAPARRRPPHGSHANGDHAADGQAQATLYIGRIGLRDDEHEPRLIDWRAPAAHPFYAATPKDPNGLIRRRHIYTRRRTVTGVDDEVFDLDRLSEPERQSPVRRGHADRQHHRRRAPAGWPTWWPPSRPSRTGSSAPACRACWSSRAARAPARRSPRCTAPPICSTPTAARWSGAASWSSARTPPSCATSARSCRPWARPTWCSPRWPNCSPGSAPRPTTTRTPPWSRATTRWSPCCAGPCATASGCPRGDLEITVDGLAMTVPHETVLRARDRARGMRRPHNVARKLFVTEMLGALAPGRGGRRSAATSTPRTCPTPAPGCGTSRRSAPPSTTCGHSSPRSGWSPGCCPRKVPCAAPPRLFLRPNGPRCSAPAHPDAWTVADVPLLDEAAQLLGTDDSADKTAAPGRRPGTPGRGEVRPRGARDHRRGRGRPRGCRHAGRLEPRQRPAAHHRRTGLGRPFLGLRPRDRGRGAGAVRDGLADGHAADPDPVADRRRRRGPAGERGRRPLLGRDARPATSAAAGAKSG